MFQYAMWMAGVANLILAGAGPFAALNLIVGLACCGAAVVMMVVDCWQDETDDE